jgi:hypothetical protein
MNYRKKVVVLLVIALVLLTTVLLTLPTYAAPADESRTRVIYAQVPTRVPTPAASNGTDAIASTRPGRCEVPVLWRYLGELRFDTKCKKKQRERGTLDLQPRLGKGELMMLLVEWRSVSEGKIQFKCTGILAYEYPDSNLVHHLYSVRTKPGENLHSVRIFSNPYNWTDLYAETTSECVKPKASE